jgi:hypothetical protein
MPNLKYGHAPGHVRETACEAFEAFCGWNLRGPEPTVTYEINYIPRQIPISRACGLVWNCTDILGGDLYHRVQESLEYLSNQVRADRDWRMRHSTYGAAAQAILGAIKELRDKQAA